MRSKILSLLIGLVLILTMLPSSLSDDEQYPPFAELHVGPGQTYETIQEAVDNATDGDQIFVHPGTYTEIVTINDFRVSGLYIYSTDGPETTIIDGTGLTPNYGGVVEIVDSTYVEIAGFTIMGAGDDYAGVLIKGLDEECYGNQVHNCNITGNFWGAMITNQTSTEGTLTLRPNSEGSLQEFTVQNSTTHWEAVDEVEPELNFDAPLVYTYGGSIPGADHEYFNIEDHTTETGEISDVIVYACIKGQDGSFINGFTLTINDTINGRESDPFSYDMTWENYSNAWGTNCVDDSWTWENVDDLEIGVLFYDETDDPFFYVTQMYAEVYYEDLVIQPTYQNEITECTFFNNGNEAIIVYAQENTILRNNFINNNGGSTQAYSSGDNVFGDDYPDGGNYWSDFDETSEGAYDDFQGVSQDESGPDGIVDLGPELGGINPYLIMGDVDQDTYPLIEPYEEDEGWGDPIVFDDVKMTVPQYPDPEGWDVCWERPGVGILADDWMCNESGYITDIHFWLSSVNDSYNYSEIWNYLYDYLSLSIYSDAPAGSGGVPYSRPNSMLWGEFDPWYYDCNVSLSGPFTGDEGWYNEYTGYYEEHNHEQFWRVDITGISDPEMFPFYQVNGTIYWLAIDIYHAYSLGWKTSTSHFMDCAVGKNITGYPWEPIYDPITNDSLDFAFIITSQNIIPVISDIQAIPNPALVNTNVNISCTVTDENISDVRVIITGPFGFTPVNVSMSGSYYYEQIYNITGTYTYHIWAIDNINQTVTSGNYTFDVTSFGDPIIFTDYKMHFPQYPDPLGWDVSQMQLAEDWLCTETGTVDDIHFWISSQGDAYGPEELLSIMNSTTFYIWFDIPAPPYSHPGGPIWSTTYLNCTIEIAGPFYGIEGIYVPDVGYIDDDHFTFYRVDMTNFSNPFYQEMGNIYWFGMNSMTWMGPPFVGWKTSNASFMDTAVYDPIGDGSWAPALDPITMDPLSYSLVITHEVIPEQPTFYVDKQFNASTPGWHVTHWNIIHEAVENASAGYLVLVNGDGDSYDENVYIGTSIDLRGNYTTTRPRINGTGAFKSTIEIISDWVNVSGFYIYNSIGKANNYHGIAVGKTLTQMTDQYNVAISDCYIVQANDGIMFRGGGYCTVEDCEIGTTVNQGCWAMGDYHTIDNNYIHDCNYHGVELQSASFITVSNNTIYSNDDDGVRIWQIVNNVTICDNNITNNDYGVYIGNGCRDNKIYHNNFVNNNNQAYDYGSSLRNKWYLDYPQCGNYWDDHGTQDIYSGPGQNWPGSDLICDLNSPDPYVITTGVNDSYPFYAPFNGTIPPEWNEPPVATNEDPDDLAINISITYPQVSIDVSDLEGDTFNISIHSLYLTNISLNDQTNGTFTANLDSPLPFNTPITWYVDLQGNGSSLPWNNYTYTFITEEIPPIVWVDDNAAPGWYDYKHVHTIPEAITNVSVGGFIYVYNGTYKNTAAGAFPNPPGGTTNIRVWKSVTIHGETIPGGLAPPSVIDAQGRQNAIMINCSTGPVIIEGLTVFNWTRRGIAQYKEWQPVTIRNNTVVGPDTATGAGNCISASGNYSIIESNRVYGTQIADGATGILLYSASYCLVRWNHITPKVKADNGIGIAGFYYNPPTYNWNWYARNNTITNNTIENTTRGITIEGWVINNTIEYNTIKNTKQHGIRLINVSWTIPAPVDKRPTWTRIYHNNITYSNWSGVYLQNTEWCSVEQNYIAYSNHSGVEIPTIGNSTLIYRNHILYNILYGILIHDNYALIYDNYFNNTNNAYDDSPGTNWWNVTKSMSINILGRSYIGGNYWHDYTGLDTDGDFLGDTNLPYNSSGDILNGGDYHPLTMDTLTNLPPDAPFNPAPTNNTPYYKVYDIWLNCTVTDPNEDAMDVSFYWGNGTLIGTISGVRNNTEAQLYLPDYWNRTILGYTNCTWVTHDTTHTWYVVANDTLAETQGPTWDFHTGKAWDLNTDRNVNYLDISAMVSHYSLRVIPPGIYSWDINEDTYTNYLDVSSVVGHYGETY